MSEENRLSQAEIEALLSSDTGRSAADDGAQPGLSDAEQEALGEIGRLSFGAAATTLSTLLQQPVEISDPKVQLLPANHVQQSDFASCVWTSIKYSAGLEGACMIALESEDARTVADLMLGGTGVSVASELNDLHLSALSEAMNQAVGTAATALSSVFHRPIRIDPPRVAEVNFADSETAVEDMGGFVVQVAFQFRVGEVIDSTLLQLIPLGFAREMIHLAPRAETAATDFTDTRSLSLIHI